MIYFILIFAILATRFLCSIIKLDQKNKDKIFIRISFFLIYLVCALRASTVGRDIPGYARVFEETASVPFGVFDYVYYENGYILLMKLCLLLKMNFQWFMAVCYVIMLAPIAVFINKYSRDKLLSVIVFICYMYFEFYLTGLRQALSMSIFLIGLTLLIDKKKHSIILYYIFNIIAILFHKGAVVCLVLPFIKLFKKPLSYSLFSCVMAFIMLCFRSKIFAFAKKFFEKDSFSLDASLYIGGNLIILIIIGILSVNYYTVMQKRQKLNAGLALVEEKEGFLINVYITSIVLALFFGAETSARSYMYYNIPILIIIPDLLRYFDKKAKIIFGTIFTVFFIAYFYVTVTFSNSFDILPYKFFWN